MKLYLGAGSDRKEGFTHVDIVPLKGIDVVCDITKGLPFDGNSCDYVFTQDFLEHLPADKRVFVINEIYRVLEVGGRMEHWIPNAGSFNDFSSPTHLSHWCLRTFDFFEAGNRHFEIDRKFMGWKGEGFKKILAEESNFQEGTAQTIHVIYEK